MFIIIDWTGRVLFNGQEFETFEDAWEKLYRMADEETKHHSVHCVESFLEDYEVVAKDDVTIRETRYLEPNHPNNGHVAIKKG